MKTTVHRIRLRGSERRPRRRRSRRNKKWKKGKRNKKPSESSARMISLSSPSFLFLSLSLCVYHPPLLVDAAHHIQTVRSQQTTEKEKVLQITVSVGNDIGNIWGFHVYSIMVMAVSFDEKLATLDVLTGFGNRFDTL